MKDAILVWFSQAVVWLLLSIRAGLEHNWLAVCASVWIILASSSIGILSIKTQRNEKKLNEKSVDKRNDNESILE